MQEASHDLSSAGVPQEAVVTMRAGARRSSPARPPHERVYQVAAFGCRVEPVAVELTTQKRAVAPAKLRPAGAPFSANFLGQVEIIIVGDVEIAVGVEPLGEAVTLVTE